MGLTRIRAEQISDIDYKQAVRVITLTNITLSGGAPAEVDGVSLITGDRVLVNGQTNAAQNGLYQVQTVGAGSNGTWVRTSDANQDGEIQPGMVVMVTQGTVYADTPWKLTTNGEIIIGTTELIFAENYSLAFGNIVANGTAVLANTVSGPVSFVAGNNISITGNNTAKSVTFDVTGISLNSIANGTSNVTVVSSGGNVTVGVDGSEVAEFSTVGLDITGVVAATGNITGGNLATAGLVSATGNVTGGNIATAGELKTTGTFLIGTQQFFAQGSDGFSVNENFNAGNATVTAYHYTSGAGRNAIVFDTAVTGQFTTGFGATGNAAQNKFVSFAEFSNTTWEWRKSVGISAPNLNGGTLLANLNPDGNLYTLGTITGTGNVTGGNLITVGLASVSSIVKTGSNGVGNIGQVDNSFNTVFAKATSAQYADVAERYLADADYPVGTVLVFGGDQEVTQSQIDHTPAIAGTVSDQPAYVMNTGLTGDHVITVALLGRVPVRVIGTIRPGDLLVASELPGVATSLIREQYTPGCVIGKALESYDSQREGTIEVVVGRL